MLKIAENIKKYREQKNISRESLAADLSMSLSNYSKIERGEIDLSISRVQEIAQILEVDISQLLNFDATQIFNISNNRFVQGFGSKVQHNNSLNDEYVDKYIKMLEDENVRLKANQKSI
jgi:transcriptional regulator with XRE-family HTH domain